MDLSLAELESHINNMITDFYDEWHPHTDAIMSLVEKYAEQRYRQGRQDSSYDDTKALPKRGW